MKLDDKRLDDFLMKVEKYNRNKIVDYEYVKDLNYVDPNKYIKKLDSNRDHIVFGRRGSGKTTLLQKSIESKLINDICVIVDCEPLKDNSKTNLLLELLQSVIKEIKKNFDFSNYKQLRREYNKKYKKITKYLYRIIKNNESNVKEEFEELNYIYSMIVYFENTILQIIKMEDEIQVKVDQKLQDSLQVTNKVLAELGIEGELHLKNDIFEKISTVNAAINLVAKGQFEYQQLSNHSQEETKTISFVKVLNKKEIIMGLKEPIVDFLNIYYEYYKKRIVLYLDDFYQIHRDSQPFIINYLHQINKVTRDNAFSFKLASLPNRFNFNEEGKRDLSIEDDFSTIEIDKDLSDISAITDFLLDIMSAISEESIMPSEFKKLFRPQNEINYLVCACGGSPRDFSNYLEHVIRNARKNNKKKISRRDIYYAANKFKARKEKSIEDENILDKDLIIEAMGCIRNEIINGEKTNIFLYPLDMNEKHEALLKSLINLGYIHLIKEEIISDYHQKKPYVPYLIDMSQYVTEKSMKPNFNFRKFWVKDDNYRAINITSAPIFVFPEKVLNAV